MSNDRSPVAFGPDKTVGQVPCKYCKRPVAITELTESCWATANKALQRMRQPALKPHEVAVCDRCMPMWQAERNEESHAEQRRAIAAAEERARREAAEGGRGADL